ncbi:MAG: hypothetical protein ACLTDM_13605 [Clostridium butyricum]
MITVFANKSLLFRNLKTGEEAHVKSKELGRQLPDWIVNDPLFDLAIADGSLTAMTDKNVNKKIENGDFNKPGSFEKEVNKDKTLDQMEVEELKAYAEERGIDIGKATSQSGILEKIKETESPEE